MRALASPAVRMFVAIVVFAVSAVAQDRVLIDGKPVLVISNDRLTLAVRSEGGSMVRVVLNVLLSDGQLTVEDRTSGIKVVLAASRGM
jgi:hypothetical protein